MSQCDAHPLFQDRLLIMRRHRAGRSQAHSALTMGISRECVEKWLDRYADEGEAGVWDR